MSGPPSEDKRKPRTCVVVSYWSGVSVRPLHTLLSRMRKIDAGAPFDLVVVCNGGDQRPLTLPRRFDDLKPRVLNRENTNYNLGAWDFGWRNSEGYEYYLFVQDDCLLKQPDWVYGFERRMDLDPGVGLLGEVEKGVGMSWRYACGITAKPKQMEDEDWIDINRIILSTFEKHGVPCGDVVHHIPALVMFTRSEVLRQVGGFRWFGPSKEEAIAAEVAFSREIAALGYRLSKVTDVPFRFIGHTQWRPNGSTAWPGVPWRCALHEMHWHLRGELKLLLGMRRTARREPGFCPFPIDDDWPEHADCPAG